jgi:hypothetical protein
MAERFMGVAIMQTIVDSAVIRSMPIRQRIDWLMDHARRHSVGFQSPESFLARSLYTAQHQTAVVALKCMDGRLNLSVATGTPAGIIEANMQYGRTPDDGFLLLAVAPYHEIGVDRARAELKSGFMAGFATEIIRKEYPNLAEKLHVRSAVIAWQSRVMEVLNTAQPEYQISTTN